MASRTGLALLFLTISGFARGQNCPPEGDFRRDCHPWINASEESCQERGCIWCETEEPDAPFCIYDDAVCPSEIPDGDREDCFPEGGANKAECNQRGCIWCQQENTEVPWCFPDDSVSQGGELCPADIAEEERIDCHPEPGASEQMCLARGCFWCPADTTGAPWCFMPKQNTYRLVSAIPIENGFRYELTRPNLPSLFGADINTINLDVEFQRDHQLRLKFYDPTTERFEVPLNIETGTVENPMFDIVASNVGEPFRLQVTRVSTGAILFDTGLGGLVFSDQYIQFSTYLNSPDFYGFGEHEHHLLNHDVSWTTFAMYSRDLAVTTENLYGVQPYYMNIEESGDAHSVLFLNANAQEVTLMPAPGLTYRTIGGVLDMYMFLGPEPNDIYQQYQQATGLPPMVPYWTLGFQLCRWGYENSDHMKAAVNRMRQYDIPHDIQYGDIDYMDGEKDFTWDQENFPDLPEYVQQLKQEGTRFVIILDPAIASREEPGTYPALDEGNRLDVWVKDTDGSAYEGEVWPGFTYYPDYTKPITTEWWTTECINFRDVIDYAALWIDMNEPSNFIHGKPEGCADNRLNFPPYIPSIADRKMEEKTICPDATMEWGSLYDTHSLYGYAMSIATEETSQQVFEERSVVFSRSTFPGTGHYAQHWLGDNWSEWSNLRWSVIGILEFNMFGFPYVGADICGFIGTTTEEMCIRWQQLGAFYTFSRNHNAAGNPDQDPGMWPTVAEVTRETLHIRYTLLPYLYTLMHRAHIQGDAVLRPLFYEFHEDRTTYNLHDQFMWGPGFLISPVLDEASNLSKNYQYFGELCQTTFSPPPGSHLGINDFFDYKEGATTVDAYFPDARWFSYYDGAEESARGETVTLAAPLTFIPLHMRGGYILPTQQPANSTDFSRLLPMGLIVAQDDEGLSRGTLFWDDGVLKNSYETGNYFEGFFDGTSNSVTGNVIHDGYAVGLNLDVVRVMGYNSDVTSVTLNSDLHESWTQDSDTRELRINDINIPIDSDFNISWE